MNIGGGKCMLIDFEIQQGLPFVFTNLPNLFYTSFGKLRASVFTIKKHFEKF